MHATEYDKRRHDTGARNRLRQARRATNKTRLLFVQVALVAAAVLALLPV